MAKRKKSLAQQVVSTAAPVLPGPLKSIVTSRLGAPLTLMVVGGLIGTGVLQFNWQGGRPRLSVDEQRAAELEKSVSKYVDTVQENIQDAAREGQLPGGWSPQAGHSQAPVPGQAQGWWESQPSAQGVQGQGGYYTPPAQQPAYGAQPQPQPYMAERWQRQR